MPGAARLFEPLAGVASKRVKIAAAVGLAFAVFGLRDASARLVAEITLGRADTCSIGLPDDTFASQLHARVFLRDAGVWVEDLGSTNGTHLNGAKLTAPVAFAVGDRLQVGSTIFEAQ